MTLSLGVDTGGTYTDAVLIRDLVRVDPVSAAHHYVLHRAREPGW